MGHQVGDASRIHQSDTLAARLTTDTDPQVHFVVGQVGDRLAASRRGAGGEADGECPRAIKEPLRQGLDGSQISTLFGGGAGDLLDEDNGTESAPPRSGGGPAR